MAELILILWGVLFVIVLVAYKRVSTRDGWRNERPFSYAIFRIGYPLLLISGLAIGALLLLGAFR